MRRALLPTLALVAFACTSGEETPLTITQVEPGEVAKALGDVVTVTGTGLDKVVSARMTGTKSVALALETPGASPKVRVPSGLTSGRYDLTLTSSEGAEVTRAAAITVVDGELQIEVSNIGQGDGGFVRAPNGRTLILDGGRANRADGSDSVAPILVARGLTKPDFGLVTHFDADHLGGLVQFLEGPDKEPCTDDDRMPTQGLIDYADDWATCASNLCVDYYALRACNASRTASGRGWTVPAAGDEIPLGAGVKVKVVALNGRTEQLEVPTGSDNSNSIALLIQFGAFRYFTAGDLTGGPSDGCNVGPDVADMETPVSAQVGKVDVLHVDHHGSCTSTNPVFLGRLAPQVAVVSVGENNSYGHPHQDVVDRLGASGARLFLTSPGITTAGTFPKTRLPANTEPEFGHLRIHTSDGKTFLVDVVDDAGRQLSSKSYTSRGP